MKPTVLRVCVSAMSVVLLGVGSSSAVDDEPLAPVGTQVADLPGVRVVERVIEGRLLGAVELPESLGRGLAVLLVPGIGEEKENLHWTEELGEEGVEEYEETPRQLWALFAEPSRPPQLLVDDLPSTLQDLELFRGGEGGEDQLWLGGDGVIYRFSPEDQKVTAILAAPGLELSVLEQTGLLEMGNGVAVPELGRLRLLDRTLRETAVYPLPVAAERRSGGLILSSPHVVRPRADAMPFFVGPEARGTTRLWVGIIDPGADGEQAGSNAPAADAADSEPAQPADAWIRLPAPEDVERSKFVVLDGIPRLAVTTTDAERLGMLEELKFRLFALRSDRTRGGAGPLFQAKTQTKFWYTVGIDVADLNRDGKDDLALIQPEGLGAGDLLIEVYLGLGDGRVSIAGKRRSKLDAPDAYWHWGDDLTGDGVPDLFVASWEKVQLLAGEPDHRSRVVEKRPVWAWEPSELESAMRRVDGEDGDLPSDHYERAEQIHVHDLDGDGDLDLTMAAASLGRVIVRFVLPH
ncbi:MAG: VCBS repeat-containing protein [Thermoanaerobaculia bacterium]|nr:VCBS repeat-containing protein [Thermoanaerobaculia bacterium]